MCYTLEQRYCIKFCQKLGDTQAETVSKIQQAFGDDAMGVTQIKDWFNRFKHGRMSMDSEQRSGRPSTSRNANVIEKVRTLIMEDRRLTIRQVADEVGISRGSANTTLTEELGMQRLAAKLLPKLLSPEQQQLRLEVAQDMLEVSWPSMAGVRQAPYSPDMANCDFWLFPKLKTQLKGRRFDSRKDIKQNATAQLHAIPKEAFQNCFQRWKNHWAKCVESQGAYFEGD
ncbi:hypothetical protein B7P43_G04786 [Cryptotermes secundus]|uniref:Mos1 transposase HTH domain-containing protein n=1 Tax=Cryptotermes secundus TaxID=105785 RepID=A0A2J7PUV1_9NEOP|nr:hypothetical protein B7P43_G04786 [Cryptotermes secundus]